MNNPQPHSFLIQAAPSMDSYMLGLEGIQEESKVREIIKWCFWALYCMLPRYTKISAEHYSRQKLTHLKQNNLIKQGIQQGSVCNRVRDISYEIVRTVGIMNVSDTVKYKYRRINKHNFKHNLK